MKKLLSIFTLLLLISSCTKEVDVSPSGDTSGEVVSFTASMVGMADTKATLLNSWSGGEEVALFVGDELYQYSIAEDGTMSGDDIIVDRDEELTYTAFYPYNETLATIEEYEAACSAGNVDYMTATTATSGKAVELQFTHQMAALSFTITAAGTDPDIAISLFLDGILSNEVALEVDATIFSVYSKFEANYFVADGTDISSALIQFERNGSTTLHSIKRDDTNTLEAGNQYQLSYTIVNAVEFGSGTEDEPYVIYSADNMRKVGTDADGWSLDSHYLLAWDIDLGSESFTSIGTSSSPFTGTFDGDGYEISGVSISSSSDNIGLFGYTSGATIKGVGASGSITTSGSYVGGIIGYADNSTVSNCYNNCLVEGSEYAGGIVGYTYYSTVSGCYNTAVITGTAASSSMYGIASCYVGGIIGYHNNSTAENCYNTGSIEDMYTIGGIVGEAAGDTSTCMIKCCWNIGYIDNNLGLYLGNILGVNSGCTVSYCFYDKKNSSSGAVNMYNDTDNYVFGLTTAFMQGDASTEGTLLYYLTQGGSTSWMADTENINNGYPILTWQTSNN